MSQPTNDNGLAKLLELIDTELAKQLLADLKDDERRKPQLYSAINQYLLRHKFQLAKLQPDADVLGELGDALETYKAQFGDGATEDEIYRH
ncbi:putative DNA packaging protein small subunit [Morganella phage vB_MmoP_Lilpapawes]|uniref:DNA packaging protein small subunit n=1 Tax=Morganella phage vB_MmoP_Lilpapawes TaxID=2894803 RepID=A0AAE8YP84_9CAUD|nr:putative DNA packaging protein small subunit [Morganella phage vB_MmoP_Lilpapawes]